MKRVLLTILQLSVTIAMLCWVFHDPVQRAKMWEALHKANYWWVAGGVIAYLTVEASAALRWQILLRVQKINHPCGIPYSVSIR